METINIKIDLEITTHENVDEHPFVNIGVNGYPYFGEICETSRTVEFDVELLEDTDHVLRIEFMNKNPKQDVIIENGEIVADKGVEIASIKFDDIELDYFQLCNDNIFTYTPIDPEGQTTTGFDACKLSWNGYTTLNFRSPAYIWLLENL